MNEVAFEERYVLFLDIIGWSEASRICSPPVIDAVQLIHQQARDHSVMEKHRHDNNPRTIVNPIWRAVEVGAFSDNIVVSMPKGHDARIVGAAATISRDLLQLGFLCRGGIALGPLYHRESVVFGPALVDAVSLEKEAVFPRILLAPKADRMLRENDSANGRLSDLLIADILGRETINLVFLGAKFRGGDKADQERRYREAMKLDQIHLALQRGLSAAGDNPKHLEKWRYMQRMLPEMTRIATQFCMTA